MAGRVDLDAAERVITRPHVIELRDDGWTLMHPPACHPDLFACPVNRAAGRSLEEPPPQAPGRYFCDFDPDGVDWGLVIGVPADDSEGVDWAALVAEARAARAFRDAVAKALAPGRWRGFDGPDGVDPLEVIEDVAQALERHDQAAAHRFSGPSRYTNEHVADLAASAGDVPRLVAELRAARDAQQAAAELRGVVLDDLAEWAYDACGHPEGGTDPNKHGEVTALLARARQLLDRADPPLPQPAAAGHTPGVDR